MATVDPLEVMLRAWGAWHERARDFDDEHEYVARGLSTDSHPIARASQFAPGKRRLSKLAQRRGGVRLREITGQPLWATEPMRCVETRTSKTDTPHDVPSHVQRVETAVLQLHLWDPEIARVVRLEYRSDGTQGEKADRARIDLRRYRARLETGRVWLHGRLGVA